MQAFTHHPRTFVSEEESSQIVKHALLQAKEQEVSVERVLAIIVVESAGRPKALSPKGARGLMQVMPTTGNRIARALGERPIKAKELYQPALNIRYGTWYFSQLVDQFNGNTHAATAAYFWGPGEIDRRLDRGKKLPKIYPGKVEREEEWLVKEFTDEFELYLWRTIHNGGETARIPECHLPFAHTANP